MDSGSIHPLPLTAHQQLRLQQLFELLEWTRQHLDGAKLPVSPIDQVAIQTCGLMYQRGLAVACEIKGGSTGGLGLLLRSMVESLINAMYILAADSDQRLDAYVMYDNRSQLSMGHAYMKTLSSRDPGHQLPIWKDLEAAEKKRKQVQLKFERKYGKGNLRWPPLEQRAITANVVELYDRAYRLYSHDVHGTLSGLDRATGRITSTGMLALAQDGSDIDVAIGSAYVYIVALLNTCADRFGVVSKQDIGPYDEIAEALLEESTQEAKDA